MSAALLSGLFLSGTPVSASGGSVRSMENIMENRPLKADDTLQDMLEHPALRSFAKHLLPRLRTRTPSAPWALSAGLCPGTIRCSPMTWWLH